MNNLSIFFKRNSPDAVIPTKVHSTDAGYDLYTPSFVSINPMERKVVDLGFSIQLPAGFYARIAPRSGLAVKKGLDVLAGTIDEGYKNSIGVVLINLNFDPNIFFQKDASASLFGSPLKIDLNKGDRIAQLIIAPYYNVKWVEVNKLDDSDRNMNGFGSSGN